MAFAIKNIILTIFLSLFLYKVWHVCVVLDILNDLPSEFDDAKCSLYSGVIGAEDLVSITPYLALASSDDRMTLWVKKDGGPNVTEAGAMYSIQGQMQGETSSLKIKKIPIQGFPKNVGFHPHGLYYLEESKLLYAVSHGYNHGGERIEVLKVSYEEDQGEVRLEYVTSLATEDFQRMANGHLNDLAVVSEKEFYVTVYQPWPDPYYGRQHPRSLWERFSAIGNKLALFFSKSTYVWRCTTAVDVSKAAESDVEMECTIAADGFGMANGIAIDQKKSRLAVIDVLEHEVVLFKRNTSVTTSSGLIYEATIPTKYAVDNIEYDRFSGDWFMGSLFSLASAVQFEASLGAQVSPGGIQRLHVEEGEIGMPPQGSSSVEVSTSGKLLSGISAGIPLRIKGDGSGKSHYLLGSWAAPGILLC